MKQTVSMPTIALLSGGLATRLRPMTHSIPKAMVPICEKPFIAHQLTLLKQNGIEHVVICAGFMGDAIQSFVGDGKAFSLVVDYSFDGEPLLGTGGALKKALPMMTDPFMVMYGDSYLLEPFQPIYQQFIHSNSLGLMTVYQNNGLWDKSNIEFRESKILQYDKINQTPKMKHIDYGLGLLRKSAFSDMPINKAFDLTVLYQTLLKHNQLAAYEAQKRFYENGSFSGIEALEQCLRQCGSEHTKTF